MWDKNATAFSYLECYLYPKRSLGEGRERGMEFGCAHPRKRRDEYDREKEHERTRQPRVDEAHHRVSRPKFKDFATEMVCWAAGGPQTYSGHPIGNSYRHLMTTDQERVAFMDGLQKALYRFEVPRPEQDELKTIVENTKGSIVLSPPFQGT